MTDAFGVSVFQWRTERADIRARCISLVNEAFADHVGAIGSPRLDSEADIDPRYTHAVSAVAVERIVGVLLFGVSSGARSAHGDGRFSGGAAHIGLVSVARGWRGRGVGTKLLDAACVHASTALGAREACLETVDAFGVVKFFSRAGFGVVSAMDRNGVADGVQLNHVHIVMGKSL